MTQRTELVGRDAELRRVEDLLGDGGAGGAAAGRSRVVMIGGVAGVGKTALVTHVAALHPDHVLQARGVPWERSSPLGILRQLLGDVDVAGDAIDPLEISRLVWDRLTGSVTTLVVVDDAHWADPESLRTLASATRHAPTGGRLVVVLVAPGDPRVADPEVIELLDQCADETLVLTGLDPAGVGALAASRGLSLRASVAESLAHHTLGVPVHVLDLIDELPRSAWNDFTPHLPAPSAVATAVRGALHACSADAADLAQILAVVGPDASLRQVVTMLDREIDAFAAVEDAVRVGLVRTSAPRAALELHLTSSMVRAAVLDVMGASAVAATHRRAADLTSSPEARLRHLVAAGAGDDPGLADELEKLAGVRADEGAWSVAAELLLDASRLTDDAELRAVRVTRAVDAVVGSGDTLAAATLLPELESMRETPLRNAVLGYLAVLRGRAVEAGARLDRSWDLVNADRDAETAAVVGQRHVLHHLCHVDADGLERWSATVSDLVGADHFIAIETDSIRGLGLLARGDTDAARLGYEQLASRQLRGAQVQRAVMGRGWMNTVLCRVDEARTDLERAVPTSFFGGSRRISLWALAWLARAEFLAGDWEAADRAIDEGVSLVESSGMVLIAPLLYWTRAQISALRGDWATAEHAAEQAEIHARDYDIMRIPACLARAHIAEARADYPAVVRALEPVARRQRELVARASHPGFFPWADTYANALVMVGEHSAAADLLLEQEAVMLHAGRDVDAARLSIARGRLAAAQGDISGARDVFEAALTVLEESPLRPDRARVTFAYGQTLRRTGKRAEADVLLTAARDLYAALGAETYVARCERELRAGGVSSRGDSPDDVLTPQERAVADLVAGGRSNREVAAELFISIKTVQYHLTNVYAKLAVRSRTELALARPPADSAEVS